MTTKRKALIGGVAIAALSCFSAIALAGGFYTPLRIYMGGAFVVPCGTGVLNGVDCNSVNGLCIVGASYCSQRCYDAAGNPIPPSTNPVRFVSCAGGSTKGVW